MKRELNVKNLMIGILVLGISTNGFAETSAEVQKHDDGSVSASATAIARPGSTEKQLPGDLPYEGLLSSLKDNAGKEIETQVVPVGGSAAKGPNLTKENLETIQKYVEGYKAFRLELEACNRDKDAGAKALTALLDTYTKKLRWSLFEKKDANGKVEIKKEADEKTLVTLSTEIKELLLARGERLKSDATKPFASEQEKKIAAWLDATHAMFFKGIEGKKEEVEKVVAEAKKAVEADVKAFKDIQEVDVCKLGAKPSTGGSSSSATSSTQNTPVQADTQVTPATGNQDPGAGQQPGGEQPPQVFGNQPIDPTAALAGLDAQFASRQAQQDELLRRALDEQARLAAELARQQNEALALQNQNNDEALAAALKALGQNNNDQPAVVAPPAPPAPITPPQVSTGSGEQQQPLPQPQDFGQQQGPMPMMMPPMPQPSAQPQIYVQEPSRFNQDEYNRPRNATITTSVNPQSAGMLAQTQLLNALRMGANGQQGGNGQQSPNVMSSRLQGLSAGNPLRNGATQRSSSTRATGAINATSGSQALAISGRAKTVPSDLVRGSLNR